MINSRQKGAAGEREVAAILREELELEIHRNWQQQAAEGGADLSGVPGWAIEIKRGKNIRLNEAWKQAAIQAARVKGKPVLIYRFDRQDWFAMMDLYDLRPDLKDHNPITLSIMSWCHLVRRELDGA
jgi:Holliday junction resolvase